MPAVSNIPESLHANVRSQCDLPVHANVRWDRWSTHQGMFNAITSKHTLCRHPIKAGRSLKLNISSDSIRLLLREFGQLVLNVLPRFLTIHQAFDGCTYLFFI